MKVKDFTTKKDTSGKEGHKLVGFLLKGKDKKAKKLRDEKHEG